MSSKGQITGLAPYNTEASVRLNWRDQLNRDWLGTSTKSSIRGRTLDEDGEIKANLGDWIVGNSTAELTNAAKKRAAKKLEQQGVTSELIEAGIDVGINDTGATIAAKKRALDELNKQSDRLRDIVGGGDRLAELKTSGPLTADRLRSAVTDLKQKNRKNDPGYKLELSAAQATLDGADADRTFRETQARVANQMANRTASFQESQQTFQQNLAAEQARNRLEDKRQNRAENVLTRQINAENMAMQMQLEYARLAQSDRQRIADRKDQAIMALLGGLGNLGAAFTV